MTDLCGLALRLSTCGSYCTSDFLRRKSFIAKIAWSRLSERRITCQSSIVNKGTWANTSSTIWSIMFRQYPRKLSITLRFLSCIKIIRNMSFYSFKSLHIFMYVKIIIIDSQSRWFVLLVSVVHPCAICLIAVSMHFVLLTSENPIKKIPTYYTTLSGFIVYDHCFCTTLHRWINYIFSVTRYISQWAARDVVFAILFSCSSQGFKVCISHTTSATATMFTGANMYSCHRLINNTYINCLSGQHNYTIKYL